MDGKIPFPFMTKGEIFIICMIEMIGERTHRHGSMEGNGHRGSMSDMNSILHQSVAINAKGGILLINLVGCH
jgi:hypothetical protein